MLIPISLSAENEIDGAAFVELTEANIKSMVPLVKKICRLQTAAFAEYGCICYVHRVMVAEEGQWLDLVRVYSITCMHS